MISRQQGFTIIELVVVIVILGILAAVAFPKFQDLSGDAQQAVVNGSAAALQTAAVISFAKAQGSKAAYATIKTQVDAANVTFGGDCATPANAAVVTVVHTVNGLASATVDISEYCSG